MAWSAVSHTLRGPATSRKLGMLAFWRQGIEKDSTCIWKLCQAPYPWHATCELFQLQNILSQELSARPHILVLWCWFISTRKEAKRKDSPPSLSSANEPPALPLGCFSMYCSWAVCLTWTGHLWPWGSTNIQIINNSAIITSRFLKKQENSKLTSTWPLFLWQIKGQNAFLSFLHSHLRWYFPLVGSNLQCENKSRNFLFTRF